MPLRRLALTLFSLPSIAPLAGCTILAEAQVGGGVSPAVDGGVHTGMSLAAHVGASETPNVGLGASARLRGATWGFVPELGPQAFLFPENDDVAAPYLRLATLGGLGVVDRRFGPTASVLLNPGVVYYPRSVDGPHDPSFVSLSLSADLTYAPVGNRLFGSLGICVGGGIGGVTHR